MVTLGLVSGGGAGLPGEGGGRPGGGAVCRLGERHLRGAFVSIVQVKVAGVGSVLPAGSVARTWKVWEPSARPL